MTYGVTWVDGLCSSGKGVELIDIRMYQNFIGKHVFCHNPTRYYCNRYLRKVVPLSDTLREPGMSAL